MELFIKAQQEALFYREAEVYPGLAKIAHKVMKDIEAVTGELPGETEDIGKLGRFAVLYGTIGRSPVIDDLISRNAVDAGPIHGKRESFLFQLVRQPFPGVDCALVIAGSDKRGSIYGLFHLSKVIGVSPLINWADARPVRRKELRITEADNYVSREPSVKYRGFFINDEWPALGTWATERFGGLNAKMYDAVFELLLRLKGNYLWPAMWASVFSDDGPGLESARLADEYGVIMGMSHHEPCLRHGEEYKRLRGKDSPYGDAWNFRTNREGIIRFWEDGLKRSGAFENVITVGMRGEQDTAIMGKDATLADNIELLRDVITVQNGLISEIVSSEHEPPAKMLALYKEVEAYFYGDESTPGLIGSSELDDVILMLSDDNFGNLRTLPTEEMRKHKGGYGIYYHFDYHGWPISYEWVNSNYLPKVWEQMTTAWEFGVRDLWIVNVGDICTNEFPLSYFLELAYDFETWGTNETESASLYTRQWIQRHFAGHISEILCEKMYELLMTYTRIAHMRRPEAMNPDVYHVMHFNEADRMLDRIEAVINLANELKDNMPEELSDFFFQQVYFPSLGNMNVQKMQILAAKNMTYARQGRVVANQLADEIDACLKVDEDLEEKLHEIGNGRWFGMGLSEHIGFKHWNEEECSFPLQVRFKAARKPGLVVSIPGTAQYTQGGPWTGRTLYLNDFLRPDRQHAFIDLSSTSDTAADYRISASAWFRLSSSEGTVNTSERIMVSLDQQALQNDLQDDLRSGTHESEGRISISCGESKVDIIVPIPDYPELPEGRVFLETDGYIAMEAEHYYSTDTAGSAFFRCLPQHGRTLSAMKAFPVTSYFTPGKDAPSLSYRFYTLQEGTYSISFYMSPSNPVDSRNQISFGLQVNSGDILVHNTIPAGSGVGDDQAFWAQGVLSNNRRYNSEIYCKQGLNSIRIFAASPAFVLERIVLNPVEKPLPDSALGPEESFF